MSNVTAIPTSVVNSGNGMPWSVPSNATGTGIGTEVGTVVTSYAITTNVVTFVTAPQAFVAGQTVVVTGMFTGTYLNGVTLTVLASGLSSTGFTANFTHADVASTYDAGMLVPTTTYTTAANFPYLSPSAGQYVLYISGQDGPPGSAGNGPHVIGPPPIPPVVFLASSIFSQVHGTGGVNGYPIGEPAAGSTSLPFAKPTLPSGSTVVGIYPYATGSVTSSGGAASLSFGVSWSGGAGSPVLNGNHNVLSSIGTDLNLIPTVVFSNAGESSQETDTPYTYSNSIVDYGVAVLYTTTGTPVPATQLQTLVATSLGLSIPTNDVVHGVRVAFDAGTSAGSGTASLVAQLTLAGTPVGITKTIASLTGWSSPYTLGGNGDSWGNVLRGSNVNGASGLGVNISGTLPSGDQINLNSLVVTVYYSNPAVVAHITIGNTRPPTVGFN